MYNLKLVWALNVDPHTVAKEVEQHWPGSRVTGGDGWCLVEYNDSIGLWAMVDHLTEVEIFNPKMDKYFIE